MLNLKESFIKYVKIESASDENSQTYPSTSSQIELAKVLVEDCNTIGLSDVKLDEHGYVTATLPSNSDEKELPVIGFLAHMDTSPSFSGKNVNPQIIKNYDGKDILLKNGLVLSPKDFPGLNSYIGMELITTDGTTLLGADDKAGVAEILCAMSHLINHPEIKHGKIRIAFTPDEEVGHGVDKFDVQAFGADFAYTLDGGGIGELESECFNAAKAKILISGTSVHPGTAYGIMKNAVLLATEFAGKFPENETPATTRDREGFYHLTSIKGDVESAALGYIIRDFDKTSFEKRKACMESVTAEFNDKYGQDTFKIEITDQYYNMADILKDKKEIIALAEKAMIKNGVTPDFKPIRGGTDGARLTYMGLPCPNIFTGGHNYHGPYEYIVYESMQKAVDVIITICSL